jgi:hypothetical protein
MEHLERRINWVNISEAIDFRNQYVAERMRARDPTSGTSDDIVARFPQRHICNYCSADVMKLFQTGTNIYTFSSNVDGAIKAAKDDCTLYQWLLDFVIRSRGSKALVGEERFFAQCQSLPGRLRDVYAIQFLIGTPMYSWPCANFDVFAEEGQ